MVEVLIAGAGPAGAAAALVLARAGVRVLLVDRARFPRPKLCGDTLNPGALAVLDGLGLRAEVEREGLRLDGMCVTSGRGLSITGRYPVGYGVAITRTVLDHLLVRAAAAAGAQVEEGVRVAEPLIDESRGRPVVRGAVLQTSRGRLRVPAGCTIAADGHRSTLSVALGLLRCPPTPRRWAVGAYFSGVEQLSTTGEMHIREGYYIGVAPVPGGLANACVVTADRRRLARPLALLRAVLTDDTLLAPRFADASQVGPTTCLGPLAVDAEACGVEGLLLAGDAAGFVDPMTGDGLRFALGGGHLAATAVLEAADRPTVPAHRRLARARRRAFGCKPCLNRVLRGVVGSERGVRVAQLVARLSPALVRRLILMAGDISAARGVVWS